VDGGRRFANGHARHDHGVETGVMGAQPIAKGGIVAPP
jgi:hypothetical protein